MEDISISSIIPINQNFEALQAENLNLKKSNQLLIYGLIGLVMIAGVVYYSKKMSEEEQK
ncbi:hypothetical protein [Flavobacterium dankookense]|uniref:Uncharacterized protein n=1 Tax=Flavobacterium dankookense TaxID=706186 RepID=A0A4R6QHV9_9FLAO|nr:hypothetical protein [Flavobacterium dankookense]TDP61189.1 hypothetical protein BC748_0803 [Flavobacterium dankookense]